jgi:peptidoglycan lytic transglycosylase B
MTIAQIFRITTALVIGLSIGLGLPGAAVAQQPSQPQPGRQKLAEDNWLTRMFQSSAQSSVPGQAPVQGGAAREWSGQSGASHHPLMTADAIRAAAADFGNCIAGMEPLAEQRGISREAFEQLTAGLRPDLSIMDLLDAQPEFNKSPWDYLDILVSDERIARGREVLAQYASVFSAMERAYGVDRHIIAAIWGVESNYGTKGGDRSVLRSTATLACVGRRRDFFREEFFSALEILARGDVKPDRLIGSWAGAFGPTQFMPTTFKRYAVDFDGDGRRDIWTSPADIFASIANYLRGHGWVAGSNWGREVKIPKDVADHLEATLDKRTGGCSATRNMTVPLPLSEWRKLGVRSLDGTPLPVSDQKASLFSGTTRHFLAYSNYDALLEYNCSNSYALSVITLGERVSRPPTAKGLLD